MKDTSNCSDSTKKMAANEEKYLEISSKSEKTPLIPAKGGETYWWHVNKPLIPLKIFFFSFYGGAAVVETFVLLYLKQLGLTIAGISLMNIIMPIFRCAGPIISGIIADKIGRSKPVLIVNLILSFLIANSMLLFIPRNDAITKDFTEMKVDCPDTNKSECIFRCPTNNSGVDYTVKLCCTLQSLNLCDTQTAYIPLHNYTLNNLTLPPLWSLISPDSKCSVKCYNLAENIDSSVEIISSSLLVFFLSLTLNIAYHTVTSSVYRILDSSATKMANDNNSNFGRERVYATISFMVISPIAGIIIDITSPEGGLPNYDASFYVFDVFVIIAIIASFTLDVEILTPEKTVWKKTWLLSKKRDVMVFVCVLLVVGCAYGFEGRFSNLFLDEIKAPTILISLKTTVIGFVGIPALLTANWLINKFGSTLFLVLCFGAHIVLCLMYSILVDPWYALCIETLTIFSYHLFWVAVVKHCHDISPEGLTATVTATAGAIHFALGEGTGSLIGGFIMSAYGARWAYRSIAIMTSFFGLLYITYLYFRNRKEKESLQKQNLL